MGRVKSLSAWKVTPAPDPDDVLWGNHEIGGISRVIRRIIIFAVSFFSIVLWIIPTTFAVSLANTTVVSSLSVFSFLDSVVSIKSLIGIIEGIIPPIIIFIAAEILLVWLTFLTRRFEGHRSRTTEILSLLVKYYCFQIVDIFLPSLLGGSLLGYVEKTPILNQPLSHLSPFA
jgi:calcium permeable stress-gated cation channel